MDNRGFFPGSSPNPNSQEARRLPPSQNHLQRDPKEALGGWGGGEGGRGRWLWVGQEAVQPSSGKVKERGKHKKSVLRSP